MNILVCISKAPDTTSKIAFTNNSTQFDENGVQYIVNPYDEWYALVRALELKESIGGNVTIVTVGTTTDESIIRKALAIGADEAVRIDADPKDAYYAAMQIASYAKAKGFDLVMTGKETINYNGSQVGGMIAEAMDLPFISDQAKEINIKIFETIYYASLEKSMLLAKERFKAMKFLKEQYDLNNWTFISDEDECREYNIYNVTDASILASISNDKVIEQALKTAYPIKAEIDNLDLQYLGAYSSFKGSPASFGQLQFDLWNVSPTPGRYDWTALKENIMSYGIRNSLLVAPMPTASTSQILGNNECFEPITSNIYSRKTLAGDFVLVNKYLVEELLKLGLWNEELKNSIIANKGSVSHIQNLSPHLKEKYKIVWEMPMKEIINMSRDRGAFICQSQSLNLWIEDPDSKILTNMHFYSWKAGLKTGIYYLRRKARHQAQQFTIEPNRKGDKEKSDTNETEEEEKKDCLMCSG
jgi:ribonucleotide reductase alpha subunit